MSAIVLGHVILPSAWAGIELVENGRFETGDLSGWTTPIPAAPDVTISSLAYSGSWCARLAGDGSIGQDLIHPPTSQLTFRIRCENPGDASAIYVIFWQELGDTITFDQRIYTVTDDWQRVSVGTPTDAYSFFLSCDPVGAQPPPTTEYSEPKLIDDVSVTFESDEYFYDVDFYRLDESGDGYADGVEVWMNVDTTYTGALYVYVDASLLDANGQTVDTNQSTWYVTSNAREFGIVTLHLPSGNPVGWYDVALSLYEDKRRLILEDTYLREDAVYLFPPDYTPPSPEHPLTIGVEGSGTTFPAPGSVVYADGAIVLVDALPDEGWILDHWILDDVNIGDTDPATITMDRDHTITAVFVEATTPTWDLTIEVRGEGTTDPAPQVQAYPLDTVASVTATPDTGWMFDHWQLDDVNAGSMNPIDVTMDAAHTLVAVFVTSSGGDQPLEIEVSGSGTTQPSPGMHAYPRGSDIVVSALPDSGWQLAYWLVDSVQSGSQANITVTMDSDHAIVAVFTPIDDIVDDQPPIAEAGDDQTVAENTDVSFDATASSDDDAIVEYHWDFGDGTTDTGATCTHRYTTAGRYTVTLTVIDAAEHSDTDTLQVTATGDDVIPGFEWWMLIPVIGIVLGVIVIAFRRRPS
jgi:PKD repeat protein